MAREIWEYNTFTHNLIRRKGLYYQNQITTFINSIYNAEDEVSGVEIYLVYRFEADIKSVLYKYIQNIEHSVIAAIENRNPQLRKFWSFA